MFTGSVIEANLPYGAIRKHPWHSPPVDSWHMLLMGHPTSRLFLLYINIYYALLILRPCHSLYLVGLLRHV